MGISSLVCKLLAAATAAAPALACNSTHPTGNHTSTTAAGESSSSTSSLSHKTIFQFNETGTFLENIVVRQNGDLLFTSFAPAAHLYTLKNPSAAAPQMALVHTFANADGIGGIAETSAGSSDEESYVIVAMNFTSFPTPAAGSSTVEGITLDCATGEVLSTRTVARLPEAGLVNGIVTIPGTTGPAVLVSDSAKGVVWRVDVATGSYEPAFDFDETKATGGSTLASSLGVDGVKIRAGYLYWSNTSMATLYRIAIDKAGYPVPGAAVETVGTVASATSMDDFAFDAAGNIWVTTNFDNMLGVVPAGSTTGEVVLGSPTEFTVAGDTAAVFGRTSADSDVLYITTCGAMGAPINGTLMEPGKIVAVDTRGWL